MERNDAMIDPAPLVRSTDPETSLLAAVKAAKASTVATQIVWRVMLDGKPRIDEEIWVACRRINYICSLSTIQHGRLALSSTGYLADTGERRRTSDGCQSIVWVNQHPAKTLLPPMLQNPMPAISRRQSLKQSSLRTAPPPETLERWRLGLLELWTSAKKAGIKIDPSVVELGRWLRNQGIRPQEPK